MQSEETIRRGRRKVVLGRKKEQKFPRKHLSNFFSYILNERQIRTNEMSVGYGTGEGEEKISSESIPTERGLLQHWLKVSFPMSQQSFINTLTLAHQLLISY
jgi:hypothetical protein